MATHARLSAHGRSLPALEQGKAICNPERHDQFRSAPPPALSSARYARVYLEVLEVGARDSTQRPARSHEGREFYGSSAMHRCGTRSADSLRWRSRQTLAQNARTFALLNVALHDLVVTLVETKYHYHFWRPETAIRRRRDGRQPAHTSRTPTSYR